MNDDTTGVPLPDWALWRDLELVKLLEAVALSVNVDPDFIRPRPPARRVLSYGPGRPPVPPPPPEPIHLLRAADREEFFRRLRAAMSRPDWRAKSVGVPPDAVEIPLVEFGKWARSRNWDVPPDLPGADHPPALAVPADEPEIPGVPVPPVLQEAESAVPAAAAAVHQFRSRRNALDPIIDLAKKQATNPEDKAAVWNAFMALALSEDRPHPLIGFTDGAVRFHKGDDVGFLDRRAFYSRLGRRADKAR